jgi:hypothetical protein
MLLQFIELKDGGGQRKDFPISLAYGLADPTTALAVSDIARLYGSMSSLRYISGTLYQLCGIFSVSILRARTVLSYLTTIMFPGITSYAHDSIRWP